MKKRRYQVLWADGLSLIVAGDSGFEDMCILLQDVLHRLFNPAMHRYYPRSRVGSFR